MKGRGGTLPEGDCPVLVSDLTRNICSIARNCRETMAEVSQFCVRARMLAGCAEYSGWRRYNRNRPVTV